MDTEKRYSACPNPACGWDRGTNPDCEYCKRYNKDEIKPTNSGQPPPFSPDSPEWKAAKERIKKLRH